VKRREFLAAAAACRARARTGGTQTTRRSEKSGALADKDWSAVQKWFGDPTVEETIRNYPVRQPVRRAVGF
jgi:hypothetical protein